MWLGMAYWFEGLGSRENDEMGAGCELVLMTAMHIEVLG